MKKIVKIITPIAAVLAAALLFTTCKQFLADPEEFLSYWAAEVVPESFSFNPASKKSKDGTECITSASDVTLTLNLRNPKSFSLVMPTSSANAGSVINFPGLNPQPVLGTDYTLQQTSGSRLKLLYKKNFLEKHERKDRNIGVEITLTGEDGRKFSERFSLGLNVNTAPSLEYKGIGKKAVGGEQYYVLILQAKDMDKPLPPPPSSDYLHGDIKRLRVTKEGGTAADYEIESINFSAKKFNWKAGSPLLDDAVPLAAGDLEGQPQALPPTTDGWLIYYKTDVKVKAAAKSFTFSLIDDKGVSSDPVQVSTAKVKAKDVKLYTILDSEITDPGSQTMPTPINTSGASVTLKAKTETAGAKITGTVKKKENSGTWALVNNVHSPTNEVAIELPAPEPDKEVLYKISLTAGGDGFVSSAEKTFYVKVTKTQTITIEGGENAWKILKTKAEGPNGPGTIIINGEITATNAADNFGEITISRNITIKGKTDKSSDKLNANKTEGSKPAHRIFVVKNGATLTLENLTLTGGRDESTGGGGAVLANGNLIITNCDVTDNQTGANGGGIYAMGTLAMENCTLNNNKVNYTHASGGGAVFVHINGTHTMKNCTLTANEAEKGDGGGIYTMGDLTMEGCTLTGNKATSNRGSGGGIYAAGTLNMTECTLTANEATSNGNGGGISVVNGGVLNMKKCILEGNKVSHGKGGGISVVKSHLTMENCTLTDNDGGNNGNGGGVYVGDSGTFTIKDKSCITPSTGTDENKKGKNDVYLENSKKINIEGVLNPTGGIAARITPASYGNSVQVLDGAITGGTATNQNYTKFKVTPGGTPQKNWKVNNQGKLEMKPGGGSSGKTINGANADAWKQLKGAVANVDEGSTITILGEITAKNGSDAENRGQIEIKKNITIKGNNKNNDILNANKTTSGKAAHRIFVVKNGATLTLKNITLKGGIAPSGAGGGGIFIEDGGTVKLENCTIEDCETGNGGDGGAISISGTANLTGCTVKNCTAKRNGGGVYVGKNGTFTMNNCTLTGNTASANGGGGVYVGKNAKKFTMKGTSCITPSTGTDEDKKGKNDVFLTGGKMITIDGELTHTGIVARITVGTTDYSSGTKVLDGAITEGTAPNQNYTKFKVTPKDGGGWKVNNQGKLEEK